MPEFVVDRIENLDDLLAVAFQAGLASKLGSKIALAVPASELIIQFCMRHFVGRSANHHGQICFDHGSRMHGSGGAWFAWRACICPGKWAGSDAAHGME